MAVLPNDAFAKETLLKAKGYTPTFIDGHTVIDPETVLTASQKTFLPDVEGNKMKVLQYTDISVLYDASRRVPFFSAYNVDGASKADGIKRADKFHPDPRIPLDIQLSQKGFYDLRTDITEFEIGHMAANNEMAWGADAQLKAYQTFHFPNSVPQAENLNTGIWKTLESYIIKEAASITGNKKICVFTGPLLRKDDPGYIKEPTFKIPLLFFKVIVFPSTKGIFSTAFLMSHKQKMMEDHMFAPEPVRHGEGKALAPPFEDFKYRKVFQVNVSYLEEQTGFDFSWNGVKTIQVPDDKQQVQKIMAIKDAKDADKQVKFGHAHVLVDEEVSAQEEESKELKLNIKLP